MKVVFRADASIAMGTGHVMRCLTLAEELKKNHATHIFFITRALPGHMANSIQSKGYELNLLPEPVQDFQPDPEDVAHAKWLNVPWAIDAEETIKTIANIKPDWLVVDHYSLDARWHRLLLPYVGHILAIDDLADRKLHCDILLDQTYGREQKDYKKLLKEDCRMLLGSRFALLRPEFTELRPQAINKRKCFDGIKRILVTMGGTDPNNVTAKILDSLAQIDWSTGPYIDVVMGGQSPHLEAIREKVRNHPLKVVVSTDVNNMAMRMLKADLAIGAGGSTSWERCCLGLPTMTTCLGQNQKLILQEIERAGATIYLGEQHDDISRNIRKVLHSLNKQKDLMINMSERCFNLVDGIGARRIANEIKVM